MAERKATEKQLKYIWALKKELGITTQWHANMNFNTANKTISALLKIKAAGEADAAQFHELG